MNAAMRGRTWIRVVLACALNAWLASAASAAPFWLEDFESDGDGSRYAVVGGGCFQGLAQTLVFRGRNEGIDL